MSTPTFARSTRLGRIYTFPSISNVDFPSVTTVNKMLAAPQLTQWKVNQAALAAYRTRDWLQYDEETAVEMIVAASKGFGRTRANLGTSVHELIENGEPDAATDEMMPYLVAAAHVLEHIGQHYESELTLVNQEEGYAGTADVLTWRTDHPSQLAVTDWKTTKPDSTVGWREHQLQLAALAKCPEYVDTKGDIHPLPAPITQLRVVGLRADGSYDARTITNPNKIDRLYEAFLGLLRCLELDAEHPHLSIWDESEENQTP